MLRSRLTFVLVVVLGVTGWLVSNAFAARVGPSPRPVQLSGGYGFVAADVVEATPGPRSDGRIEAYDVTFRVREVLAQPAAGDALPAKPEESIHVHLSVGYAAQVEWDGPDGLAVGNRFILTIKHAAGDRYDHATGASAAEHVAAVTDDDRRRFAQLRKLSLIAAPERPAAWVAVVADPTAAEHLRSDVLSGLGSVPWSAEESTAIGRGLRAVWNDPHAGLSPALLNGVDFALRDLSGSAFGASDERARVWIARLLEPTPVNRRDNNDRDNLVAQVFRDLLRDQPDVAGPPVVAAIADGQWPEGFRRAMAAALLVDYERAAAPAAEWERALQAHFARVFAGKQAWPIRLAAIDLITATTLADRQRTFVPGDAVRAVLPRALADMKALAATGADLNASVAVGDVERAMKTIANPSPR